MIGYLLGRYLVLAIVVTFMLTSVYILTFEVPVQKAVTQATFWSGIFAAVLTFLAFRRRNLWPLYDNLRLPKYLILGVFVAIQCLVYVGLTLFLR